MSSLTVLGRGRIVHARRGGMVHGRRVLVVGSTGRLGVAVARALAQRGDRVLLSARDPAKLEALSREVNPPNMGVAPFVCADLLRDDAPETIVQGVRKTLVRVDDVVLACGPFPRTPFEALARDDLQRSLAVHAIAPLLLVQALVEDLTAARGSVVALTDAGVTRPYTNHVAYLTAKGALQSGLRALAVELAPEVRVNMVALGIVAEPEADGDPLRMHRLATRSPLGRFGTPEEVVHVVLALLDSTWATGEIWGVGR
jgi:pteridine reductase